MDWTLTLNRCNVPVLKPDVWVINFVQRVVGKRLSGKRLIEVFNAIAPLVGESLYTIDATIWSYERMAMGTADLPALRIVGWSLLKQQLEAALKVHGKSDIGWQLVLDDKMRLRYDEAGLTIKPNQSLFGEAGPGASLISLRQSVWHDGFWLVLRVEHDSTLPLALFEQLQAHLNESLGEVENNERFEASFDLDDSMMMPPEMTLEELTDWVGEIVEAAMPWFLCEFRDAIAKQT